MVEVGRRQRTVKAWNLVLFCHGVKLLHNKLREAAKAARKHVRHFSNRVELNSLQIFTQKISVLTIFCDKFLVAARSYSTVAYFVEWQHKCDADASGCRSRSRCQIEWPLR